MLPEPDYSDTDLESILTPQDSLEPSYSFFTFSPEEEDEHGSPLCPEDDEFSSETGSFAPEGDALKKKKKKKILREQGTHIDSSSVTSFSELETTFFNKKSRCKGDTRPQPRGERKATFLLEDDVDEDKENENFPRLSEDDHNDRDNENLYEFSPPRIVSKHSRQSSSYSSSTSTATTIYKKKKNDVSSGRRETVYKKAFRNRFHSEYTSCSDHNEDKGYGGSVRSHQIYENIRDDFKTFEEYDDHLEEEKNEEDEEESIYNPSLPTIPVFEDRALLPGGLKSALKETGTSRSSKERDLSNLISVPPSLDEWYQTMRATAKLGWALILYHAVRNNFRPRAFARLVFQGSREFVRGIADYLTMEPTLLSFKKGDIIRVTGTNSVYKVKGWLEGSVDDRKGMFPIEYVTFIGRSEARNALKQKGEGIDPGLTSTQESESHAWTQQTQQHHHQLQQQQQQQHQHQQQHQQQSQLHQTSGQQLIQQEDQRHQSQQHQQQQQQQLHLQIPGVRSHHHHYQHIHDDSGHSSGGEGAGGSPVGGPSSPPVMNDGKHSLLQFAMQHFRAAREQAANGVLLNTNTKEKSKKKKASKEHGADWTWKEQVEMVKFSQSPISTPLLPLDPELGPVAVACFQAVMRYMGDFPMEPNQTEVDCVYIILKSCYGDEALRDEVYCHVMKQTTNNKSSVPDSCQRGWRLFSIIAAYFVCSENLRPYLFKYLETAAYDKRRAYHGTAMVCLQNLRKTFKYGGRKNVPSIDEITAITAGRDSKRQIYRLPGGTERVINTKSTSVVQDIIEEMCSLINVRSAHEQEEFSLYCIVEGGSYNMPLAREEYVLDVTTELLRNKQVFYLIFCRSVWYYPLRLDNALYIEVVFNQIAPDYLEGLLLITPGEQLQQEVVYDIAKVAALLHRAADLDHVPTIKEVRYLLPKPALSVRDIKPPQWVNMVQQAWHEIASLTGMQAKATVLEILQAWPLFGSSFFAVKRVTEPRDHTEHILALNKNGVHFLHLVTHETLTKYSLAEVMSTRRVRSEDDLLYLDMKCGNLMQQRITRIQTDQALEIARLIRQYITIEQRVHGHTQGDNPGDVTLSR